MPGLILLYIFKTAQVSKLDRECKYVYGKCLKVLQQLSWLAGNTEFVGLEAGNAQVLSLCDERDDVVANFAAEAH